MSQTLHSVVVSDPKDIRSVSNGSRSITYSDLLMYFLFLAQTSSVVVLIRFTKSRSGNAYTDASIIASTECGKMLVGFLYCLYDRTLNQHESIVPALHSILSDIFGDQTSLLLMSVPSLAYSLQNFLMFHSLGIIDPSLYQIVVQFKAFTTALFGMCLISKRYTCLQWASFGLLSAGLAMANLSVMDPQHSDELIETATETQVTGVLCVLASTVTSGFAGTLMEIMLKGKHRDLFVQNIQLGLFGLLGCAINAYLTQDLQHIVLFGFFYGFDAAALLIVTLNVFGGYFVATVIKRASAMVKTFLSGLAVLVIIAASYVFLDDVHITQSGFYGAVFLVLLGNYLFTKENIPRPA